MPSIESDFVRLMDEVLGDYLPNYIPDDLRASSVTASDVLSHCAGFPNWRSPDFPLRTYFQPRDRFGYSGEGYLYLQKAPSTCCRWNSGRRDVLIGGRRQA
jgi:hypothetical protein